MLLESNKSRCESRVAVIWIFNERLLGEESKEKKRTIQQTNQARLLLHKEI